MKNDKLILFFVAMGFLFLVVETRYNHAGVWATHPTAYIPVITTGLGFLLCLLGIAVGKKGATAIAAILLLCSCVGFLGVYYHTEGDVTRLKDMLTSNTREERVLRSQGDLGGAFGERPLLAPMSITGLSMVGAICLFGAKRK